MVETGIRRSIRTGIRATALVGAALVATALAATALAAAGTAQAAPARQASAPETAKLLALAEKDPATGRNKAYPVERGGIVPALLGVANAGGAPVHGVVVRVRVLNDLDIVKQYANCRYSVDSNVEEAWCQFDDDLAVNGTYAIADHFVGAAANARPEKVASIVFQWFSREWADANGGLTAVAGATSTAGTGGTLRLEARTLEIPSDTEARSINFAYPKLVVPSGGGSSSASSSSSSSSASSSSSSASSVGASPSASPSSGGLPVTGSPTATVAIGGGVLLLVGAAVFLVARRRRTHFVA